LRSLLPAYGRSCVGDGAAGWAGHLRGRRRLAERRQVARAARRTGLLATAGRRGELGQGGAAVYESRPGARGREPRARRQAAPRQPTADAEAAARRTGLLATAGRRGAAVCESRPGARGREGASCERDGRRHRGNRQQMQRRRRGSRGDSTTSPRLGFTFTTSRAGLCLCFCAGSRLF
jgi:hypothetical protein